MITTMEEAMKTLENMVEDVKADNTGMSIDEYYRDLVVAVTYDMHRDITREFCRRTLGYVPLEVARNHA